MIRAVAIRSFRNRLATSASVVRERHRSWSSGKMQGLIVSRTIGSMESNDSRSFPVFTSTPQKPETEESNPLLRSSSAQDPQQQHPTTTLREKEEEEAGTVIVNFKHGGTTTTDSNTYSDKMNDDIKDDKKGKSGVLDLKNNMKSSKFIHQQVILGKLKRAFAATKTTSTTSIQNNYGRGTNYKLIQSLFQQAKTEQIDLTPDLYAQCLQIFVHHNHLLDAMEVLKSWIALCRMASQGSTTGSAVPLPSEKIFFLLIDAIGNNAKLPDYRKFQDTHGLYRIIRELIFIIQSNFSIHTSSLQQRTLPHLLCTIVQYTPYDSYLSGIAYKLYRYLMRRERYSTNSTDVTSNDPSSDASPPPLLIPFDAQIYKEILHHSANQGECYLPVGEILYALVLDHNVTVDAETVMTLLQKEYPFVDMDRVVRYLDCIDKLSSETTSGVASDEFRIDMGLLEQIMIQAARKRLPDVIRRGWSIMERYQYYPTESMYESAIHAFFLTYKSDHFGFAVMKEMEYQSGYIPSYALIRTVSNCLRYDKYDTRYILLLLEFTYHIFTKWFSLLSFLCFDSLPNGLS
jgi:hypothetical protein